MKQFFSVRFVLCSLVTIMEGYDLFIYGVILPLISTEWRLSAAEAGFIGSAGAIGIMIGSVLFGKLADRIDRRTILLLCISLFSAFTVACGFAQGVSGFVTFRIIAGFGLGGALPNVIALVRDTEAEQRTQNRMVMLMMCGLQLGGLLGPAVSLLLLEPVGWRGPIWVSGVSFLLLPLVSKYLRTERRAAVDVSARHSRLLDIGSARSRILFWGAYFFTMLLIHGLSTWLPELMLRDGKSIYVSLSFPILINIGSIVGTLLFAALAERRVDTRRLLTGLYIVGAIAVCAFAGPFPFALLFASVLITGACTYGVQNLLHAYVSERYPSELRGTGLGWCFGWGRLGAIAGSALWGVMLEGGLPVKSAILMFSLPALLGSLTLRTLR